MLPPDSVTVSKSVSPGAPATGPRTGLLAAGILLLVALLINLSQVTRNLDTGYLGGHEFRQAQTALSAFFIQRDHDYSLAYPTPVFGPPWSIPMEFPLFQWAVARAATMSEAGIERTARLVSIIGFYLALPGLFILMRRIGASLPTSFLGLALILASPIYIFYTRAILIESTALCLSIWFLVAFEALVRNRSWVAFALTASLGALASLVKVTTFAIWGGMALVIGAAGILRLLRSETPREGRKLAMQAGLAGLAPLILATSWIRYADAVKAASPGGFFLTSENLESFNVGTLSDRVSAEVWSGVLAHLTSGLLPWAGLAAIGLLWLWPLAKPRPWAALALFGVTVATWMSFPHLYRVHDYYLYAVGVMPLAACALTLQRFHGLARWGWVPVVVTAAIMGLQWRSFDHNYRALQSVVSNGGNTLLNFLRDATEPDEIIIVVGNDWSASVPYYSERRAVMFKWGVHNKPEVVDNIVQSLEGESISGLLVLGENHEMPETIDHLITALDLESEPTIRSGENVFHTRRDLRGRIGLYLKQFNNYPGVESLKDSVMEQLIDPIIADSQPHAVTPNQARSAFHLIHPSPVRYRTEYSLAIVTAAEAVVMGAHADADFWVPWEKETARLQVEFGLAPHANADEHNHSDGVWFRVWGTVADAAESLVWERWIDPWNNEADRGVLQETFTTPAADFTEFRFEVRSGPSKAYDSAFWGNINITP